MAEKHLLQFRTERFRTSLDPLWVRIRHLLIEREIDPLSLVLAYFAEEDFKLRFGIFVDAGGGVYQFAFDFAGAKSGDGRFSEWQDITERWVETPFRRQIAEAREFQEGKGQS